MHTVEEAMTVEVITVGPVIHRQRGGVELFISHPNKRDLTATSVDLTASEAATLTELFGGSVFSHQLSHLREAASAVVVDWLPIETGSRFVDRPLGDTELRTRTSVSIVAVIRDGKQYRHLRQGSCSPPGTSW